MLVLEEKLYTSEETAEILGINPRTLYRYLKKGDIECETKTKSGTFRFTREQIYKYLYPDKYEKILTLLRQKEDTKYPYINNNVLDSVKAGNSSKPEELQENKHGGNTSLVEDSVKNSSQPIQNQPMVENKLQAGSQNNTKDTPIGANTTTADNTKSNISWQKPLKKDIEDLPTGNLYKPLEEKSDDSLKRQDSHTPLHDISKQLDTVPSKPIDTSVKDINIPDPHSDTNLVSNTNVQTESSQSTTVDSLPAQNIEAIREQRKNRKLTDELENLESTIDSSTDNQSGAAVSKDVSAAREAEQNWKYFVNTNKDILQLAKEVNSLNAETGRHYAATMKGGLSLHHNIDEFNIVHFYIEEDDLNWWISHLELSICKREEANICLIPTADMSLFESAYKLRGLFVVSDDRLIQDLMKHGEKELAKTLL